jgi:hypothetical protein
MDIKTVNNFREKPENRGTENLPPFSVALFWWDLGHRYGAIPRNRSFILLTILRVRVAQTGDTRVASGHKKSALADASPEDRTC